MFLLQILLQSWVLYHWAYGEGTHTFIMTLTANFSKGNSAKFVGNATLDGILTHSLEGRTEHLNVSQLLPLEAPNLWEQTESKLQKYLESFQGMVMILSKEKIISYPISIYCTKGCEVSENGTRSFYKILLNGSDFLKFHTKSNNWEGLSNTLVADYTVKKLNQFQETTTNLQFFLQETCANFVRMYTNNKEASTGQREGPSHTPLVIGITIGALALMGLAVCLFLCTGGKR
ncbi:endothelial protein C receptor-like isoform X2 [Notechis scutatus]|uniref:Endothelial protein C receptor-like isoform X2 n=1 Tax=Notechis scutatus TaxID=8663 RepID=A0A6J1W0P1_9SAUR|nr:endothelial protein C receptor-like isoform X2 [Notechis scutatus]